MLPVWILASTGALGSLAEFLFRDRYLTLLSSVLPTVATYNLLTILGIENDLEGGASWGKTLRHVFGVFPVNVVEIWCVNLATAAILILLGAYTSNVLPWNKVIPLHPLFLFKALLLIAPRTAGAHEETTCSATDTSSNTENYEYERSQILDFTVPPHSTSAPLSTAIGRSSYRLPVSGRVSWRPADAMNPILFFMQVVLIDEPTSGLDRSNTRLVWDMPLRVRPTSALLISTHDMTEADVLADRVIGLTKGTVVCNASPTYLKSLLGVGYKVRLKKSAKVPFQEQHALSILRSYNTRHRLKSWTTTRVKPSSSCIRLSPKTSTSCFMNWKGPAFI
ncbi:hypothetical protein HPB51_011221 [Rhipicephalus microplus]|uniref:ABC transporter domain-containing protein n=1 Tax=Rhipicephalus microplus TaxID=6941 RepID=A0A9J6F2K6_RHIMP|nr:uncharacterized protein LOC119187313 [Rhipicephalus microplus]KAH8040525.1 hypothetical protein HPB51_011221 [Rhipicephalus microplus]